MKEDYHKKEILAKGKMVFIGIDVHKESWQVTVRAEEEEIFHGRLPGEYDVLKLLIARLPKCRIKVAYEAGPCGFWLYDKLTADGVETIVVPPSLIPVESGNKVKTDKKDSRKLATLLEKGMLKKVYVLSQEDRADRELVRTRRQVLEHRTDVMRQIKSKLLFHGIKAPLILKKSWSKKYVMWLKELPIKSESIKIAFDYLIELYEYLTAQVIKITKKVLEFAKSKKYNKKVQLLKTVPGIGTLIAIEMLVELQDVSRFKSAEKFSAYIGLTPSEYSTGEHTRQGRITRCGNKRVRTCAVEASWYLITKDPLMRKKYDMLKRMKGGKRAIVAVARQLMLRVRRILLDNKPYVIKLAA
ncbi:MAG: IS110 family transposase [Dissulfurispiraceae bacterium]